MKRPKLPDWKQETSITMRVVDVDAVLFVHAGQDSRSNVWVTIAIETKNLIQSLEDTLVEADRRPELVVEAKTLDGARRAGEKHARKWLRERAKARAQNVTPPTSDRLVSGPTEIFN